MTGRYPARMAILTVRPPADGSVWTEERVGYLAGALVMIDDSPYPIVGARLEDDSAVMTVDTGADGPVPDVGADLGFGSVERVAD